MFFFALKGYSSSSSAIDPFEVAAWPSSRLVSALLLRRPGFPGMNSLFPNLELVHDYVLFIHISVNDAIEARRFGK